MDITLNTIKEKATATVNYIATEFKKNPVGWTAGVFGTIATMDLLGSLDRIADATTVSAIIDIESVK